MRAVMAIAVIGLIVAGCAYWFASRAIPAMQGTVKLAGIESDVEIIRDAFGVPRILANSESDGLFALGYVHASDRLWQMDVSRRLAQGRLAERFGDVALETDRLMRALDLDGHAERSLGALTRETLADLDSYAAGVNARIEEVGAVNKGAVEFSIFGGAVDPWKPADSLSVLKSVAFQISMASLLKESARGRMSLALEPHQIRDLFPDYPGDGIDALPISEDEDEARGKWPIRSFAQKAPDQKNAPSERLDWKTSVLPRDEALGFLGLDDPRMAGASSAWAVDGSRTAGRAPLLASDPHLPLTAPSIWHPAQVSAPGLSVIGATLPGIPAIAFGRNAKVAWGLTATQLDDIDIFIEKLYGDEPTRYVGPRGPLLFDMRKEVINVKDGQSVEVTLRKSRHGPVIPLETAGLAGVTPKNHVASISWTALADDDTTIEALMSLNRVETSEAAINIAGQVVAPALNLIVADKENVGIAVAGRVPLRRFTAPFQGRLPAPGWTDRSDWVGWLPQTVMPRLIEPESGAVANANNRIGDGPFPRHLSFDWDAPYRINRIEKLLNGRKAHSIESFKAMQSDTVSGTARALLPLIGAPLWDAEPPEDAHPLRQSALLRLRLWNGEMSEHAAEPLIFSAWLDKLIPKLVSDELGTLASQYRGPRPLFLERVFKNINGAAAWCDDTSTDEQEESCSAIATLALDEALDDLTEKYGEDDREWRWGRAHTAVHRHAALGGVATTLFGIRLGLDRFVNISQETSGGDDTLNRGAMAHSGKNPFRNVHGAGYRGVYDFSDLDRSQFIVSTGASGHPMSEHYANLAPLWRIGEYMPMSLNRDDFEPGAIGTLRLMPQQSENDK
jgi:penicillin amidase